MSELIFTKQIASLAEKYGINTETNEVFRTIIKMFENKPNYQIWGIKSVFEHKTTPDFMIYVGNWILNNKSLISQLSKGNIVNYKTTSDFGLLAHEFNVIDMVTRLRKTINSFDTEQKKILIEGTGINEVVPKDEVTDDFNRYCELFSKFAKLPKTRRENFIRLASAYNNFNAIIEGVNNSLKKSYTWNKEDFMAFIANNTFCKVIYDKDNIVIVDIPNFETSRLLCGGGRTCWCITRESSYFSNYVTSNGRTQYFLFNFGKTEDDEIAHVGFTVDAKSGIVNAHSTNNRDICSGSIQYRGKTLNISSLLSSLGIDSSLFIRLNGTVKFKWDMPSFLAFMSKVNSKALKLCEEDSQVAIVEIKNDRMFNDLIGHTFIPREYENRGRTQFILFDFKEQVDKSLSIQSLVYSNDRYGTKTLSRVVDAFGKDCDKKDFFKRYAIKEQAFIGDNEIDPSILLHKYIEEHREEDAVELIKSNYDSIDVNKLFEDRLPIYGAINNKMTNLFGAIFCHEKFDCNSVDGFENNTLGSLIYLLRTPEFVVSDADEKNLYEMINMVIESEKFDLNKVDCLGDTALMISCENEKSLSVTKHLASKPTVNPNVVNNFGENALIKCIDSKNLEALKVIVAMPGIEISKDVFDKAKSAGIDLKTIVTNAYSVVGA